MLVALVRRGEHDGDLHWSRIAGTVRKHTNTLTQIFHDTPLYCYDKEEGGSFAAKTGSGRTSGNVETEKRARVFPCRAAKIVARMAKGNCTGAGKRGTWVSERPFYSFDHDKLVPDKYPKEQGATTACFCAIICYTYLFYQHRLGTNTRYRKS